MLGVTHSMTRVEMDTFPSVVVLQRSFTEEEAAKAALLECAGTFSPGLEERSTACAFSCVLDIAGTEKLHGTPATLGNVLLRSVSAIGIQARVAIAANFHTVVCLARGMRSRSCLTVVASGGETAALAQLPLKVLDLTEEQAETFSFWGIQTLGMLAALPEKALIARMGQEGNRLRQLASGSLPHLFVPMETAFALEEFMELDAPVDLLDSLLFVVGKMLEQLIVRATIRVLALASVTIKLSLEGGAPHTRTVRSALPSNDRHLWIKLLQLDLEAHPPPAAILSLRLQAEPGRTSKIQLGLFSPQLPEPTRLDVTLARIRAIVGEEGVGSPLLKDSHRPDAFLIRPFALASGSTSTAAANRLTTAMRLLRPLEDVTVTLSEKRPVSFFFRQTRYDVERAYGPWVIGGDWWTQTRWGFQQWDIVARASDGMLLCCCLTCDLTRNLWQMAALYD
jgi:protein ImuB